jgi:hypothetical protein
MERYRRFGVGVWAGVCLAASSVVEEDVHQTTHPSAGYVICRSGGVLTGAHVIEISHVSAGITFLGCHAGSVWPHRITRDFLPNFSTLCNCMIGGGYKMFAKVVGGVLPIRSAVRFDDVTGAVVCGVPLAVKPESGASAMNPAGNTGAEGVRVGLAGSLIQREPVSGAIGLGVRRAIGQRVRPHLLHAAEGHKDDFLHAGVFPVFRFRHLPISSEARFFALNADIARTSRAAMPGVSRVIQHFLKSLHTRRDNDDR